MANFPSVFFLMIARHLPKNESGLYCSYLTKLIQPLSLHKVSSSLDPNTPINTDGRCLCKQVYFPSCVQFSPLLWNLASGLFYSLSFCYLDLENFACSNVAPAAPWKQMFHMLKEIHETGRGNSGLKTQKEAKEVGRICQLPSYLISFSCLLKANTS